MAEITAASVKELRERTGAGMMECKKALSENNGDIQAAADWLRKTGLAKADKKASRVAAEGRIASAQDAEALKAAKLGTGETVEEGRSALIAKVGENVQVRRMARMDSANTIGAYVHGGRIGVLVSLEGGDAELARSIAMHVAAMNPPYNKAADVPADFVAKEKEIELAKMSDKDKQKPAEILEKIIGGKIAKIVNEVSLYGQPYVLDTNQTVEAALKAAGAEVLAFVRLAVGEGIEKQVDDFAAEVMKQAGLA